MSIGVIYNNGTKDVTDWYPNSTNKQTGTLTAADGYKITKVEKAYYGNNNDITWTFQFNRISDQQYSYSYQLSRSLLNNVVDNGSQIHINATVEKIGTEPTIDLQVSYNNGVTDVTKTFTGQKAGTVTGTVQAGTGYTISSVTGAYYRVAGFNINLDNFKATKVNEQQYNYSFDLTNDNINDIKSNNLTVYLSVETEEQITPILIDTSNLVNCSVSPTEINPNEEANVTLTADPGYILNGAGSYNTDGEITKFTCNNVSSYQLTIVADSSISISFTASKKQVPITINTSNLVNCSISPTTINQGKETTVTITANSGYILNGTGSYNVDGKTNSFTCNNVSSYQLNINANSSISISFTANKIEPSIDLKITYNNGLTDITNIFSGQKAGTVTGTVQAGTGYTITSVTGAYYRVAGFTTDLSNFNATKISDYQYKYTFDISDDNIEELKRFDLPVSLSVDTKKQPGNINIDSTNLEHCSISPSTITQGKETVLTLNADSGYILNGTGSYTVDSVKNSFTCNNVSSYQITVTANNSISITFVATKTETKASSIVHTYVLNQDDYNNLGKQIIEGVNSTATGFEQYDYTKFVNYLYEIPFKIGTEITTSTNTINLGKKNINIDCQKVTRETFDINLGTIDLTNMNTSHDYNPINITLYCPFSNNIVLPLTVLGSQLSLSFAINLKTEQATLLIKQNDNIIYSGQTELFTDLPLYFTAGIQDTLIKQFKSQYQNTIKQAYIVVNYNKPITNLTRYKTNEHGTLSSYKGFTRVSYGTLKRSVSSTLDNGILNLLSQGVIIK